MAWTDAQITDVVDTLNELAELFRTHAVRMGTLVNSEVPAMMADLEDIRAKIANLEARSVYIANDFGPAVKQDVDAIGPALDDIETQIINVYHAISPPATGI